MKNEGWKQKSKSFISSNLKIWGPSNICGLGVYSRQRALLNLSETMLSARSHGNPGSPIFIRVSTANTYLQPNVGHIVHNHHQGPTANIISTPREAHQTNSGQVVDDMS